MFEALGFAPHTMIARALGYASNGTPGIFPYIPRGHFGGRDRADGLVQPRGAEAREVQPVHAPVTQEAVGAAVVIGEDRLATPFASDPLEPLGNLGDRLFPTRCGRIRLRPWPPSGASGGAAGRRGRLALRTGGPLSQMKPLVTRPARPPVISRTLPPRRSPRERRCRGNLERKSWSTSSAASVYPRGACARWIRVGECVGCPGREPLGGRPPKRERCDHGGQHTRRAAPRSPPPDPASTANRSLRRTRPPELGPPK